MSADAKKLEANVKKLLDERRSELTAEEIQGLEFLWRDLSNVTDVRFFESAVMKRKLDEGLNLYTRVQTRLANDKR